MHVCHTHTLAFDFPLDALLCSSPYARSGEEDGGEEDSESQQ